MDAAQPDGGIARCGITVNCRIRNEERFVRAAIEAILPLAERVQVFDTGSTDRTLEEVAKIRSDRLELVVTKPLSAVDLTRLRNTMIERATTEWVMIVDGDELYPRRAVERIREILPRVPEHVHRLVVNRVHFVDSFNFVSGLDGLARIYRRAKIRHGIASPRVAGLVGHETPYLVDDPATPWSRFSMRMPPEAFFFHCQYLSRSSKDAELGRMRGWRKPQFPVRPYVGPWPDTLDVGGAATRMSLELLGRCAALNRRALAWRCTHLDRAVPNPWRLRRWPPRDLILPGSLAEIPVADAPRASQDGAPS